QKNPRLQVQAAGDVRVLEPVFLLPLLQPVDDGQHLAGVIRLRVLQMRPPAENEELLEIPLRVVWVMLGGESHPLLQYVGVVPQESAFLKEANTAFSCFQLPDAFRFGDGRKEIVALTADILQLFQVVIPGLDATRLVAAYGGVRPSLAVGQDNVWI